MDTAELTLRLRDLMRVVRQLKQQRDGRHRTGSGTPAGMVGILMTIDQLNGRQGTCHARTLADAAGLDQSTVSRAVAALANGGLVERLPDPADRRASILAISPAGRAALTEASDWIDRLLARALANWRQDELDLLTASLGRFVTDLDGALRPHKTMETAR